MARFAVLALGAASAASASIASAAAPAGVAAAITVDAGSVISTVSPLVYGCHSDLGYAHAGRGFYSQMVYGEIFEPTPLKVDSWTDVISGTATGGTFLDSTLTFNGNPTLAIVFNGTGSGTVGRANRGLGNAGMTWVGGKGYSGYIYMSAPAGTSITIALVDTVTGSVQDTSTVISPPGGAFNRYDFTLGPGSNTTCVSIPANSDPTIDCGVLPNADFSCLKCSGEVQVLLTAPGTAHIGYVFVSPGSWGTLEGLPVRLDTIQRLQEMGITAIRQGGTYARTIYWKEWRGPAAFRPSNGHVWGNSLISGWGPFDFIDACEAAGIVRVLPYDRRDTTTRGGATPRHYRAAIRSNELTHRTPSFPLPRPGAHCYSCGRPARRRLGRFGRLHMGQFEYDVGRAACHRRSPRPLQGFYL